MAAELTLDFCYGLGYIGAAWAANGLLGHVLRPAGPQKPVAEANQLPLYVGSHYVLQIEGATYTAEFRGRAGHRFLFHLAGDRKVRFIYEHEIVAAVGVPSREEAA